MLRDLFTALPASVNVTYVERFVVAGKLAAH